MAFSSFRSALFDQSKTLLDRITLFPDQVSYGSALSSYRLAEANRAIKTANAQSTDSLLSDIHNTVLNDPAFAQDRKNALSDARSALLELKSAAQQLQDDSLYTTTRAYPVLSHLVDVKSVNAKAGTYNFQVTQIARQHRIASDEQALTNTALNLAGTFKLNGIAVTVSSTDTLTDIMTTINYGEDTDRDGELDLAEDLNNNGTLDTFGSSGHLYPGGPYSEDRDFDGVLDPTEDTDGDYELDGGTQEHGVRAYIRKNRLVLERVETGDRDILLRDDNEILSTLGFIETNVHDEIVFKNEQQAGQNASVTFDGQVFSSSTNSISNIMPGLSVSFDEATDDPVRIRVTDDTKGLKKAVTQFVKSYNTAFLKMNQAINPSAGRSMDVLLGTLRDILDEDVRQSTKKPVHKKFDEISDLGITRKTVPRMQILQTSLDVFLTRIIAGELDQQGAFTKRLSQTRFGPVPSLLKALGTTGVIDEEDGFLKLDEKRLDKAIKTSLPAVKQLLDDGVGSRVVTDIDRYTDPKRSPSYKTEVDRLNQKINGKTSTVDHKFSEKMADLARKGRVARQASKSISSLSFLA